MSEMRAPAPTGSSTDEQLDTLGPARGLEPVGWPQGGRQVAGEEELGALMGGRPRLGHARATGGGASARRQVRLDEKTNAALDAYAADHGMTPSAVIRAALDDYLATA